ncbi:MAG: hypothetical protein WBY53_06520 [Acidobacteriaceae bacterium]
MLERREAWKANGTASSAEERNPTWINVAALILWLIAGVVAFLPFAIGTSPWDALILRVPGHQGNWWHMLVGAPFFLAYPMIWLRLRALFSTQSSTPAGRRLIWVFVLLSIVATILVQVPFLLHLAGTSAWQRLSILGLGFGIMIASGALLFLRRHRFLPTRACLVGLNTAYLANAALCLVVYNGAPGTIETRSGWLVTMLIFWPMLFELIWLFLQTFQRSAHMLNAHT